MSKYIFILKSPTGRAGIAGLLALLLVLGVFTMLSSTSAPGGERLAALAGRAPAAPGAPVPGAAPVVAGPNGVKVGYSYKNDESPPLSSIKPIPPVNVGPPNKVENDNPRIPLAGHKDVADPVVQTSFHPPGTSPAAMPAPSISWDGINATGSGCGCAPPDTDGDVGPTQYVQMVNTAFQVWSKTGTSLYGPAATNTIWSGFGGACEANNDGDPVVLYDQIANRWLVSQFTASSPWNECIAISTTNSATGTWYRYAFQLSTTDFYDYPHLGVWPDGYYMSDNVFNSSGTAYFGPAPIVFDRARMLTGAPATFQAFAPLGSSASPIHPADLDGSILPPAGTPNYFVQFGTALNLYKFHVDWTTPANSTWTLAASLAVAGFTELCPSTRDCIPQASTTQRLDGIGDRLMHRLAYRKFADGHDALVLNHSVDAGSGKAGVRWYEIRNPGSSPAIYQQGTYAPDTNNRWMGSAAMDHNGNLAVGYSVSGSNTFPSIRYAGRLVSDALGTLAQGEASLYTGTGFQSGVNRWGDYSALSIDPTDDCTFWYTQEYNNSSGWNWGTRIGAFKFPSCTVGTATPTVTGTPFTPTRTPTVTRTPTITPTPCGISANYQVTVGANAPIVAGSTDIGNHGDDAATTITLPFAYSFYGQSYTSATVNSNGTLQFASSDTAYNNTCLPYSGENYAIFAHWDDLRTDAAGSGVFTSVSGSAPNRIFNIEWRATEYSGGASVSFEVRLYEGQNKFEIIHGTTTNGSSTTVGVQKDTGSLFTQYSCNTASLSAGLKLTFTQPSCATRTPTRTATRTPTRTATRTPTRTATPIPCQTVVWTAAVNVSVSGNTITKSSTVNGWTAGAVSNKAISVGSGYVQATVAGLSDYTMFGLSNGNAGTNYTDIDYAIYTYPGDHLLRIYEKGTSRGAFGAYAVGDVLKVSVASGVVRYYRNATLLYTSAVAPVYPLLLDSALYNTGARVSNAYICGSSLVTAP